MITGGGGMEAELGGTQEEGDLCMLTACSHCTAETNTIL